AVRVGRDRRVEVFPGRDAALRIDPISAYGRMRREKVQVIEMFDPPLLLRSPSVQIEIPRTMALLRWVPHPAPRIRAIPSRVDVLDRDEWVCQYCLSAATTIDHVHPRARGGPHTWENLVAACGQC